MSTIEDKNAVLMSERLKELAAHFAKPEPNVKTKFDKRQHANTTIRLFLSVDGKGKFGDVRYTRPSFDARTNRNRYDGKSVFVAKAHLKPIGHAQYGESGTFEMPLSAALTYGLIRGKEFHAA